MAKKTGLGRGLEALIPVSESIQESSINEIPVDRIAPNPRQPRSRNDPQALVELVNSVQEHGVIQPLLVTEDRSNPERYVLIAGERRLMAAKEAGLETVPVVVREATDQQRLELALIENIQRADLNPLEEAEAYRQLADDFGMTHEAIAIRVSKKRTTVTNTLRLLNLTADAKQALVDGEISEGHARALLSLESKQAQSAALSTLLRNDLNVRQTEELVRKLSGNKVTRRSRPALSPEIADLEERLRSHLNTQVSMKEYRKGGSITIRYFSDEELNAILDRFFADQS